MPFNGIGGDYTKAPWVAGNMTLTHEEVIQVLEGIQSVVDEYDPKDNLGQPISDPYIVSRYNEKDWNYNINGETYDTIKNYDPEVNTLGINENGIITTEYPAE